MPARHVKYSPEICEEIIELLSQGYNLTEICNRKGMPDRVSVWRWSKNNEELATSIARARDTGWDVRAERAVIAAQNAEDPQKARLAFDAERWYLAKMNPERYSERIRNEHSGPGGKPIETKHSVGDVPAEISNLLKVARQRAAKAADDLA